MTGGPLALAVLGRGVVDPDQPWLHADDAGVLRGRAAFETMRVYGGRAFRLAAHLERLVGSAEVLGLPPPDPASLSRLALDAVEACGRPDATLRVVWTGGREGAQDGVGFALVTALPEGLERSRALGISLASLQLAIGAHARRASPWLLPGVKSTSYAVNMAAQREAHRRGADDAVFLSAEGVVLEGPTSNLWFREDESLFTPALDLGILAGVTRDSLIQLAGEQGVSVVEGEFSLARMAAADEVFTSSSVREVMPVVALDGSRVGDGSPGRVAAMLQAGLRGAAG
ncbi:MAG: 4-amino-4-deoxychorismate lyase [Gaiellales bacterium]|nr:4-amino-4-deoxychorismate lyase [Gaiellales bacterium]MDX6549734.1 4-amino-4-deoxychorismate lyase [Gaiellales bacterium]